MMPIEVTMNFLYAIPLMGASARHNGDTIFYKQIANDSLVFIQLWITSDIYQPQDTTGKLLFLSVSGLKRIH